MLISSLIYKIIDKCSLHFFLCRLLNFPQIPNEIKNQSTSNHQAIFILQHQRKELENAKMYMLSSLQLLKFCTLRFFTAWMHMIGGACRNYTPCLLDFDCHVSKEPQPWKTFNNGYELSGTKQFVPNVF